MHRLQRASLDLGYLIEFVVKAMFGIVIVYLIAKTLIDTIVGPSASKIVAEILSIALLFALIVSKRVRDEIMSFGHRKNSL